MRTLALAALVVLSACSRDASYKFADIEWGSSIESATALLIQKGYTVVDAGRPVQFNGRIGGRDAEVSLWADASNKVTEIWVTVRATCIGDPTSVILAELTKRYGPPLTDSKSYFALWPSARDGSMLRMADCYIGEVVIRYERSALEVDSMSDL